MKKRRQDDAASHQPLYAEMLPSDCMYMLSQTPPLPSRNSPSSPRPSCKVKQLLLRCRSQGPTIQNAREIKEYVYGLPL
jgi:hypothetical protein